MLSQKYVPFCGALCVIAACFASSASHAQFAPFSLLGSVAIHQFSGTDGANPNSPLIEASGGALIGACYAGGAHNSGVVYEIASNGAESALHSFGTSGDGANPSGALVHTSGGTIYGTTIHGGAHNEGAVYKITSDGNESVLYSFTGKSDGSLPYAGLLFRPDGRLYGATFSGAGGGGTIFACTTGGTLTTLHTFSPLSHGINTDGAMPYAALIMGPNKALYGTATSGGASGSGVLYQITTDGAYKVVHNFAALGSTGDGTEGANPYSPLTLTANGSLYGTTYSGGANGSGTIFGIGPRGVFNTLYSFAALGSGGTNTSGANPSSALIPVSGGMLYGVAGYGGANGSGVLYAISNAGSVRTLYSFPAIGANNSGLSAGRPYASLSLAPDGSLVTAGYYGGAAASGAIVHLQQHTFSAGLQLLSAPFDASGNTMAQTFSASGEKLAVWSASNNAYAVSPSSPADTLHQGTGFWARFSTPVSIVAAGNDLAAGANSFNIDLGAGWNMIGDPFSSGVPISAFTVREADGTTVSWATAVKDRFVSPNLYSFDPKADVYDAQTTGDIQPYLGYWALAFKAVSLMVPRPGAGS